MKNLKVALFAFAMLVGIGSAFAFKTAVICGQDTFVLPLGTEIFTAQGTAALDQVITHYTLKTGAYDCLIDPKVCTYYIDRSNPDNPVIRQCEKGVFAQ